MSFRGCCLKIMYGKFNNLKCLCLQALKKDLESTRDSEKETMMDKLHKENVRQGRDKYKTLREIRKGNTKRRVDQFENL